MPTNFGADIISYDVKLSVIEEIIGKIVNRKKHIIKGANITNIGKLSLKTSLLRVLDNLLVFTLLSPLAVFLYLSCNFVIRDAAPFGDCVLRSAFAVYNRPERLIHCSGEIIASGNLGQLFY